jgi:hypothetical protein
MITSLVISVVPVEIQTEHLSNPSLWSFTAVSTRSLYSRVPATGNSRYCCKAIKRWATCSEGPRPGFCTRSLCLQCHYAADVRTEISPGLTQAARLETIKNWFNKLLQKKFRYGLENLMTFLKISCCDFQPKPFWSFLFFFIILSGVRQSPLGTVAPTGLLYEPQTIDWQEKPKYSEEPCPSATLSTTNPTWIQPVSNPGRRGG